MDIFEFTQKFDFIEENGEYLVGDFGAVVFYHDNSRSWVFLDACGNATALEDESEESLRARLSPDGPEVETTVFLV